MVHVLVQVNRYIYRPVSSVSMTTVRAIVRARNPGASVLRMSRGCFEVSEIQKIHQKENNGCSLPEFLPKTSLKNL